MTGMVRLISLVAILSSICLGQAKENVLYSFGAFPSDGLNANGGLLFDREGNIYGTTSSGGSNPNQGTVYELSPQSDGSWLETILYNFCSANDCEDGNHPRAGLISDSNGNLYGTAYNGGAGYPSQVGVVFELSPPAGAGAWTYSVLYSFGTTPGDGAFPAGRLTWDSSGNLYGTTQNTVFELSPVGDGNWNLTTLFTFCDVDHCPGGYDPVAGVTFDKAGNLYGTTEYGGFAGSWGVLYKLAPQAPGSIWTETVIDTFLPTSGARPMSEVNFDDSGNLYLTTSTGKGAGLCGSVDKYDAQARKRQVFLFWARGAGAYGCNPEAGVALNPKTGTVYGTSFDGGLGGGNVYRITNGNATNLYNFCQLDGCADGLNPASSLTPDKHGDLYGIASAGGQYSHGVVFEITP